MAYVQVSGVRRMGLKATGRAEAQVSTIRTKFMKIGAQIRITVRRVRVSLSSAYPLQAPVSAGVDEPALLKTQPAGSNPKYKRPVTRPGSEEWRPYCDFRACREAAGLPMSSCLPENGQPFLATTQHIGTNQLAVLS